MTHSNQLPQATLGTMHLCQYGCTVPPYAFLLFSYMDPDMSYIFLFQYTLCHYQLLLGHDEAFLIPNYTTIYRLFGYEIFKINLFLNALKQT